MIYVIAGNREQADHWRLRAGLPPRSVRYIGSADGIRGLKARAEDFLLVGSWWKKRGLEEIELSLDPLGIKLSDIPRVYG